LVQNLETRYTTYPGLNLTKEVLSGQHFRITHEGHTPLLEVQVVDLADSIAYNAHDVDDALALNLISVEQIESLELVDIALQYGEARGHTRTAEGLRQSLVHSLIDVQVVDLLESARAKLSGIDGLDCRAVSELGIQLSMTPVVASRREQLAQFLFDHVYRHETLMRVRKAASDRVQSLFDRLVANPEFLPNRFREIARRTSAAVAAGQYIAGMTDRFCDTQHESIVQQGRKSALPW
jgi:dGTPase